MATCVGKQLSFICFLIIIHLVRNLQVIKLFLKISKRNFKHPYLSGGGGGGKKVYASRGVGVVFGVREEKQRLQKMYFCIVKKKIVI